MDHDPRTWTESPSPTTGPQSRSAVRWRLAALLAAMAFIPGEAAPYAKHLKGYVEGVRARVTAAFQAADGDLNLTLVPVSTPSDRARFFDVFWMEDDPRAQQWALVVNRYLQGIEAPGETAARSAPRCNLGGSPCWPFRFNDACKALLGKAGCLYELADREPYNTDGIGLDMSVFTATGEVEILDSVEADPNVQNALFLGGSGGILTTGDTWCNEFTQPIGICGKEVILSGLLALDDSHDFKPEIHPIHALLVRRSEECIDSPGLIKESYGVGTFIDDSNTDFYRNPLSDADPGWTPPTEQEYPATAFVDLRTLQEALRPRSTRPDERWVGFCSYRAVKGANVNLVFPSAPFTGETCPRLSVSMQKRISKGAAWVGKASFGYALASFGVEARLATPEGRMGTHPPGMSGPAGPTRRWYEWKVKANWSYAGSASPALRWSLSETPTFVVLPFEPGVEFSVWKPVSSTGSYAMRVGARATLPSGVYLEDAQLLEAPRPVVRIRTSNPRVRTRDTGCPNGLPRYSVTLAFDATGFWSQGGSPRWVWNIGGTEVTSPTHELGLCYGESKAVSITATDALGVEVASDGRVYKTPTFTVGLAAAPDASAGQRSVPFQSPMPSGECLQLPDPLRGLRGSVWNALTVTASPRDEGGAPFPKVTPRPPVTVVWDDLEYVSCSTSPRWERIRGELISYPAGKTIRLQLGDLGEECWYKVSARVTDGWGRTAVGNTLLSNTHLRGPTGFAQMFRETVGRLQAEGLLRSPFPSSIEGFVAPTTRDPLEMRLSWIATKARGLAVSDVTRRAGLVADLRGVLAWAGGRAARSSGSSVGSLRPVSFSRPATRPLSMRSLLGTLRSQRLSSLRRLLGSRTPGMSLGTEAPGR